MIAIAARGMGRGRSNIPGDENSSDRHDNDIWRRMAVEDGWCLLLGCHKKKGGR